MALNDRRSFLKMAALAGAFSTNSLFHQAHAADWNAAARSVGHLDEGAVAQNEDFWSVIQRAYSVSSQIINLNNGGVSPSPIVVQQAVEGSRITKRVYAISLRMPSVNYRTHRAE
jgi:hypothetical protein